MRIKAISVRIVKEQDGKGPESLEMSLSHRIAPGTTYLELTEM